MHVISIIYVNLFNIERLKTGYQELVAVGEKNSNAKASRKVSKKQRENVLNISMPRSKGKQGKQGSSKLDVQTNRVRRLKAQKAEPLMKEEGEMSDTEEVYEQFKEVKWMEWCEDVMVEEEKTLKRLQRLQSTSADLPKEKVLLGYSISCFSCLFSSFYSFLIVLLLTVLLYRFFPKFGSICNFLGEGLIKLFLNMRTSLIGKKV